VLEAARAALLESAASRLGVSGDAAALPRLDRLLADYLRHLQGAPAAEQPASALDDVRLDELTALRGAIFDTLEAQLSSLPTTEARQLNDWFALRLAQVIGREQRRNEAAVHDAERFRLAIDRSSVVVYETDLEGRLTWSYNSKLPQLVGTDLTGRSIAEFLGPEDSAELERVRRQALATGIRTELELGLSVGAERVYRMYSFDVARDASGHPIRFVGSAVDITALRRAQDELGRAVAFREQLMGILGHDLRNPLSAVRGIANLLQLDQSLPARAKEGLVQIDQAARRMSEMIETLLDFTRIRFHQSLPVSRAEMDFGQLCRQVVDETLAGHPGHKISLELSGDLRGQWDHARMAQVVSNLLGNALTHGDETAPVQIAVRMEQGGVTLDVINQGPTISAEQMQTLFEPFVQSAASRSHRRGLGLGLYIAKQIVASHDGTIAAQSREGRTTFTVSLPPARAE
jgi:PAS domain S-box-containing protein